MSTPVNTQPSRQYFNTSTPSLDEVKKSSAVGEKSEKNKPVPLDFLLISGGTDLSKFNDAFKIAVSTAGFSSEELLSHKMEGNNTAERADYLKNQIQDLHRQGRIGKHTQVMINLHGETSTNGLQFSTNDVALKIDALTLINCLRSPPKPTDAALHSSPPTWTGAIHITACYAGMLRDQLQNMEGQCILYNGKKTTLIGDGDNTMLELVRQLEWYTKKNNSMPNTRDIWKIVSGISGESISLVGDQSIEIHRTLDSPSKKFKIKDPEIRNARIYRSLFAELDHGSIEKVIDVLEKYGTEILHENSSDTSTLSIALQSKRDAIKKFDLLMAMGEDINTIFFDGTSLLHLACRKNDFSLAKHLVSVHFINTKIQDDNGATALHLAVATGNTEIASCLAQPEYYDTEIKIGNENPGNILGGKNTKFDINIQDKEGNTPLHLACSKSSLDMLNALLQNGVDFSLKNTKGHTALELAVQRGHTDMTRKLLEHGAPVNAQNEQDNTALHIACQLDDIKMIETLLAFGADAALCNDTGLSPLCTSVRRDNLDAVKILLPHSAVNAQSDRGNSALHFACLRGNNEIATLLLKYRALPDLKNKAGKSPLDISAKKSSLPVMTNLLQKRMIDEIHQFYIKRVDIRTAERALKALPDSAINDLRLSGLLKMAVEGRKLDWVKLCIDADINPDFSLLAFYKKKAFDRIDANIIKTFLTSKSHQDSVSEQAKFQAGVAVASGRTDLLITLIDAGVDLSTADASKAFPVGRVPLDDLPSASLLHLAWLQGDVKVIRLLTQRCPDTNRANAKGEWPIEYGLMSGRFDAIEQMLAEGLDPNARYSGQQTLLHLACRDNHLRLVNLLLAMKANPDLTDAAGNTPESLLARQPETPETLAIRSALRGLKQGLTN